MTDLRYISAEAIAAAIVIAAQHEGEDPESIVRGVYGSHARWYAYDALEWAFPGADRIALARAIGIQKNSWSSVYSRIRDVRRNRDWWRPGVAEAVREQLVARLRSAPPVSIEAVRGEPPQTLVTASQAIPKDAPLAAHPTACKPWRLEAPIVSRKPIRRSNRDVTDEVLGAASRMVRSSGDGVLW